MGRDFSYSICKGPISNDSDWNRSWDNDLYLRNNNYLPYEAAYNKNNLLIFIKSIKINIDSVRDYGEAIKALTNIYQQMSIDDIVYLRNG